MTTLPARRRMIDMTIMREGLKRTHTMPPPS